jgi:hypothetical protein
VVDALGRRSGMLSTAHLSLSGLWAHTMRWDMTGAASTPGQLLREYQQDTQLAGDHNHPSAWPSACTPWCNPRGTRK